MSGDVASTAAGVFAGATTGLGGLVGGVIGNKAGDLLHLFKPPPIPSLLSPNALSSTPTKDDAARAATRQTLDNERMQFSTAAVLTGGAGVLDNPQTTSRTLLGS
jgi:hypothetical protein